MFLFERLHLEWRFETKQNILHTAFATGEMCKGELIVGLSRHRDVHPTVRVRHHLNAKADGKIELGSLWNESSVSSYLAESS
jgi:hypothetical protein